MQDESNWPDQIDPLLKRALSHPKRLEILGYLAQKRDGTSEGELADALGLTVSLTLYHLRVLHDTDLIAQVQDEQERANADRSYVAAAVSG